MKYLIRQAIFLPFYFLIPVFVAGSLVPGYSAIQQHGSEITVTEFTTAKALINTGAILSGLSCILLALGVMMHYKKYYLSSILLSLWGVSMISNGLYPMGTPMHGLYGMGLSVMITPFVTCYEWKGANLPKRFFEVSIICGLIISVYFWGLFTQLDPPDYRGLTQRIAAFFIFGWIAFYGFEVHNKLSNPS